MYEGIHMHHISKDSGEPTGVLTSLFITRRVLPLFHPVATCCHQWRAYY